MRGKLVFAAILMAATAGCGPSKVDVTGKVSLKNGTPLPGGMLVISPSAGGLQGGARAYLNMDGTFKLSTDTDGDGVVPGLYKVLVVPPPKKGGEEAAAQPIPFDKKYCDYATSGLEMDISPSRKQFDFILDANPVRK